MINFVNFGEIKKEQEQKCGRLDLLDHLEQLGSLSEMLPPKFWQIISFPTERGKGEARLQATVFTVSPAFVTRYWMSLCLCVCVRVCCLPDPDIERVKGEERRGRLSTG